MFELAVLVMVTVTVDVPLVIVVVPPVLKLAEFPPVDAPTITPLVTTAPLFCSTLSS